MEKRTRWIVIGAVLVIIAGVAWYGLSPLFNTIRVDDALPTGGERNATTTQESATESGEEDAAGAAPAVRGPFAVSGTAGHPASGDVYLVTIDGEDIIRYENFSTINGPNLHLYLANDLDANDYVDLGEIRGTEGNINYPVPDGVDVSDYRYVMYWCVPFSVLFNYAEINTGE